LSKHEFFFICSVLCSSGLEAGNAWAKPRRAQKEQEGVELRVYAAHFPNFISKIQFVTSNQMVMGHKTFPSTRRQKTVDVMVTQINIKLCVS
jgi:hypothetical protein